MTAVTLERTVQSATRPPPGARPVADPGPLFGFRAAAGREIEPWELHSELMYIDPDVRRLALELLPERDPYAFLPRAPAPVALPADAVTVEELAPPRGGFVRYTLRRVGETVRLGFAIVGVVFALAMLAELLPH